MKTNNNYTEVNREIIGLLSFHHSFEEIAAFIASKFNVAVTEEDITNAVKEVEGKLVD